MILVGFRHGKASVFVKAAGRMKATVVTLWTLTVLIVIFTVGSVVFGVAGEFHACEQNAPTGKYERLVIEQKVSVFPLGAYCEYRYRELDGHGTLTLIGTHRSGPELSFRTLGFIGLAALLGGTAAAMTRLNRQSVPQGQGSRK